MPNVNLLPPFRQPSLASQQIAATWRPDDISAVDMTADTARWPMTRHGQ